MPEHKITLEVWMPVTHTFTVDAVDAFAAADAIRLECEDNGAPYPAIMTALDLEPDWSKAREPAIVALIGPDGVDILDEEWPLRMHLGSFLHDGDEERMLNRSEFQLEFDAVTAAVRGDQVDADDLFMRAIAGDPIGVSISTGEKITFSGTAAHVPDANTASAVTGALGQGIRDAVRAQLQEQHRDLIRNSGNPVQIDAFKHAEDALANMTEIFGPLDQNAADCGFAVISATAKAMVQFDEEATVRLLRVMAAAIEASNPPPDADPEQVRAFNNQVAEEMNTVDAMFKLAMQRQAATQDKPTIN